MKTFSSVLLTGASSGIGAALALRLAGPGVSLAVNGRDRQRLDEIAATCRGRGATVDARILDVTDAAGMAAWIAEAEAARPLDLVIANAGISAGTGGNGETAARTRAIFGANVGGVLNTVLPAIDGMRHRRHGQIAIVSSLAAFRGLPGAPAYCASKAAVKAWGEGLRGWLAADGVGVSVICPGFVESRITARNAFPMPLLMTAERTADIILRGLAANRARIAFPLPLYMAAWLLATLPPALVDGLAARLPRKGE